MTGTAAASCTAPLLATQAVAGYYCSEPWFFNGGLVRRCTVEAVDRRIKALQECDQWCWAACIEAAFEAAGYEVSQAEIVEKLFGPSVPCVPTLGPQIAQAVEGSWIDRYGDEFYATTRTHVDLQFGVNDPMALQNASRYLADDIPLIIGSLGHATLLSEMTWVEDNFGQQRLEEVVVRDPWPGNQSRRLFSPWELRGTSYLAAVIVQ